MTLLNNLVSFFYVNLLICFGQKTKNIYFNIKKLKKVETRKSYLTERKKAVPPTTEVVGFSA